MIDLKLHKNRKGSITGTRTYYNQDLGDLNFMSKRKENNSISKIRPQNTTRPLSAKADFAYFTRNRRNSNNMMTSQNFINGIPLMRTFSKRPQTTASHALIHSRNY